MKNSTVKTEKGVLVVLSGPSGAGKGTIYDQVTARNPQLWESISVTTRDPRPNEEEGVQYYFRSDEEYMRMKENGEFLETAGVYGHYYGTPLAPVKQALQQGKDVLFEIDIVGAKQIKAKYPQSVAIFIIPPSFAILEERLRKRGTETEESLALRIGSARSELAEYPMFDYIVFNDTVEAATQNVEDIINASKKGDTQSIEKYSIKSNEEAIKKMLEE